MADITILLNCTNNTGEYLSYGSLGLFLNSGAKFYRWEYSQTLAPGDFTSFNISVPEGSSPVPNYIGLNNVVFYLDTSYNTPCAVAALDPNIVFTLGDVYSISLSAYDSGGDDSGGGDEGGGDSGGGGGDDTPSGSGSKITYSLSEFDATKVASGALCVMVSKNYNVPGTITNTNSSFRGVGICRYKEPNTYLLTISSELYKFNEKGKASDLKSKDYKVVLGEVIQNLAEAGGAVGSGTRTVVTRSADGSYSSRTTDEDTTVLIDSLTARDNFAINALKTLMLRADKDPASLSNNEMSFYCDIAYLWAANMMSAAAKVRATMKDETGTSVDEESLTTNTEKLLYDMSEVLNKTAAKIIVGGGLLDAQRITIPELTDSIKNYTRGSVIYKYRNKSEAVADGWSYSSGSSQWQKVGYNAVSGSYTDEDALGLPTWKYVNVVSVAELKDVVIELKGIKTLLENIANSLANL